MTVSELFVLAFVLLFFGGLSGAFTFVSLRLIWQHLAARGLVFELEPGEKEPFPDL